jgi:hypothetical protein
MLANTSRTDKRAAQVCSALVGHPGITPGGKLYRRSPQWNPCLLRCCSIAPRWEADEVPVSPLGASPLLALRLNRHRWCILIRTEPCTARPNLGLYFATQAPRHRPLARSNASWSVFPAALNFTYRRCHPIQPASSRDRRSSSPVC